MQVAASNAAMIKCFTNSFLELVTYTLTIRRADGNGTRFLLRKWDQLLPMAPLLPIVTIGILAPSQRSSSLPRYRKITGSERGRIVGIGPAVRLRACLCNRPTMM